MGVKQKGEERLLETLRAETFPNLKKDNVSTTPKNSNTSKYCKFTEIFTERHYNQTTESHNEGIFKAVRKSTRARDTQ